MFRLLAEPISAFFTLASSCHALQGGITLLPAFRQANIIVFVVIVRVRVSTYGAILRTILLLLALLIALLATPQGAEGFAVGGGTDGDASVQQKCI